MVTLEQRTASNYLEITQNEGYSSVTRARFHAKLANQYGKLLFEDGPYFFCLHLSLFLFAAGLLIYFFNINRAAFYAVVWFIAITTVLYTSLTVLPIFDHDFRYVTPFSRMVLPVYLGGLYAMVQVFSWIKPFHGLSIKIKDHHDDLVNRFSGSIVEGNAKLLEKAALEPSSEIDSRILERMLLVLDEDHVLETFFDAVPGFCGSELVQPFDSQVRTKLQQSLDGFLDRTFSSHLVPESVRNDRFITCLEAAHSALGSFGASQILGNFFHRNKDEVLKSVELGHSLISWGHSIDDSINPIVRWIVACIIAHAQDRGDRWTKLVKEAFDVPDRVIRDYVTHGDSMLLAILIHVAREALLVDYLEGGILESFSQIDIRNTLVGLQHDFCALWNEIVQEARNDVFDSTPTQILTGIRHLFITLHQGTDAAPNQFSAFFGSIDDFDPILCWPPSYPSCDIPGHHPDSAAQGLAIAPPTIPPPQFRIRCHSEPVIGASAVQRPRSSLRLRRTQSLSHFPSATLPTQPSYPPNSSPRPALVSPRPLTNSPDAVTKDAIPDFADISAISGTANPTHGSSSSSGPTTQQVEETRTTPPSVVLGSLPTPLPTPALNHSAISSMLPSSMGPVTTQTHVLHHPPGAPTLTTTPLSVSLQDTTDSGQHPNPGRTLEQDDIHDSQALTPRMDHGQPPPGGATVL